MNLDNNTKLFLTFWVVIFIFSFLIYTSNYIPIHKDFEDLGLKKICIEDKKFANRAFIYNDSIFIGSYFIDYENRRKKDKYLNKLQYRLKPGKCILLTDHPKDSVYLVDGNDTILFVNLYTRSKWSIFN